ncbi:MAG TPA: biotin synthase BioB [Gemmataceae bacterium]|jgi:biotin synthase|nr:biotin synthase BioB [Gemmataceae bacterium]
MSAELPDLLSLARRVITGGEVTREEARALFLLEGEDAHDLFYAAHKVRRHFHGDRVTFCSILPTKFGNCGEDCKFCAQSGHFDTGITAHPMMGGAEVADACRDARDNGASAFGIVNSGRGPTQREWPKIMEAVRAMKAVDGICHCATLGTLDEQQARDLKEAGVRRINHNLETSETFFPQIVSTHTWQERVETVRLAQRVGLETCCGCIFGMGETVDDRVSLAFSLKELNPNVVPLNFLFPIPGTPLENAPRLRPMEILKIIAVMRLVLPRQDLKVAGGREKNLRDLQSWIFYVGGTSGLIGNYLATAGRPNRDDLQMIEDLELTWHEDRVGDADPAVAPPAPPAVWALPVLS